MKKWFTAVAAVVAVAGIAGCGSDNKDSSTPSSATSAATSTEWTGSSLPPVDLDAVDTWPEFGRAGTRLLADCDPTTKVWGCISDQYVTLDAVYQRMPHDSKHAAGAIQRFLDIYHEWEEKQCWTAAGRSKNQMTCSIKESQMNTIDDSLRRSFDRMREEN